MPSGVAMPASRHQLSPIFRMTSDGMWGPQNAHLYSRRYALVGALLLSVMWAVAGVRGETGDGQQSKEEALPPFTHQSGAVPHPAPRPSRVRREVGATTQSGVEEGGEVTASINSSTLVTVCNRAPVRTVGPSLAPPSGGCLCKGCVHGLADRPENCCVGSLHKIVMENAVFMSFSNVSINDGSFNLNFSLHVKQVLAIIIVKYCTQHQNYCIDRAPLLRQYQQFNGSRDNETSRLSLDNVVLLEFQDILANDTVYVQVVVAVVLPGNNMTSNDTITMPLPVELLLKVLNSERRRVEMALGVRLVGPVRRWHGPVEDGGLGEGESAIDMLPIGGIVAGAVMGASVALCCIVSAIKAVADRKLIRIRNEAIREARRQKHERETADLKLFTPHNGAACPWPPPKVAVNGNVVVNVAEPAAVPKHIVQVTVHTETPHGEQPSNGCAVAMEDGVRSDGEGVKNAISNGHVESVSESEKEAEHDCVRNGYVNRDKPDFLGNRRRTDTIDIEIPDTAQSPTSKSVIPSTENYPADNEFSPERDVSIGNDVQKVTHDQATPITKNGGVTNHTIFPPVPSSDQTIGEGVENPAYECKTP